MLWSAIQRSFVHKLRSNGNFYNRFNSINWSWRFDHIIRSERIPRNSIKHRRCRYRKYRDIEDIGGIKNSSKLKNLDKTRVKVRLWLWANDSNTSLTWIRDGLWVSRRCLFTSLRCIKARLWMPWNYLQGPLRSTRGRL